MAEQTNQQLAMALTGILEATKAMRLSIDLPDFTFEKGDMGYDNWINQFDYAIDVNNWTNKHAIMVLQSKFKGRARSKLQEISRFENLSKAELIQELRNRFKGRKTTLVTFLETIALRQGPQEPQDQWAARVKATASKAGTTEQMLILGMFVQGQKNSAIRDKLYEATEIKTIDEALEKATIIDAGAKAVAQGAVQAASHYPPKTPWEQQKDLLVQQPEPMEVDA